MCYICVLLLLSRCFFGVMISLERLAMAASSIAQKTKETGIDAEHRISALGTYLMSIVEV